MGAARGVAVDGFGLDRGRPPTGAGPGRAGGLHGRDRPAVVGATLWLHVIGDVTVTAYWGPQGRLDGIHVSGRDTRARPCTTAWLPTGHACRTRPSTVSATPTCCVTSRRIIELEKEPDSWASRMQRLLLAARDLADRWYEKTGGPVPESVRGLRRPPGVGARALQESAAAGPRASPRPQPGPGPVAETGGLPPVHGQPGRALHQQPGGAGPAHDQAPNEDFGGGTSARGPGPNASPACWAWPRPPASSSGISLTSCD